MKRHGLYTFSRDSFKNSYRSRSYKQHVPFLALPEAIRTNNAESFGKLLKKSLRLRSCKPSCTSRGFYNTTTLVNIQNVSIIATNGCGVDIESGPCEESLFIIPFETKGIFRIGGQDHTVGGKRNIVYVPPVEWEMRINSRSLSGLMISIRHETIVDALAAICGTRELATPLHQLVQQPDIINASQGCGSSMLDAINSYLRFIETIKMSEGHLPSHLRLDDLLVRQLLLLRFPLLAELVKEPPGVFGFEQLLEWIRANCCEPISLSELEARSGYSRRSLQRAFQARFGCGPMQWLRKQRMEIARRKLETAPLGTRVQNIAHQCGYISLSSFCRDYNQMFCVSPRKHLNRLIP